MSLCYQEQSNESFAILIKISVFRELGKNDPETICKFKRPNIPQTVLYMNPYWRFMILIDIGKGKEGTSKRGERAEKQWVMEDM